MGPEALSDILECFGDIIPVMHDEHVMYGLDSADDAAVYRVSEDLAVILTVDFLTPVADDPFTYGAIAAANSMSDVYAMGGRVVLALNVAGFPEEMPHDLITGIFQGGASKISEAGAILAGGHTVMSKEPFYGLAVLGFAKPSEVLSKDGANAGDIVFLSKPLGTGIITSAAAGNAASEDHLKSAMESMLRLNSGCSGMAVSMGATACTDVTGFGLAGHVLEIADRSGVMMTIDISSLPFLDGAEEYAENWLFPGGTCRNLAAFESKIRRGKDVEEEIFRLIHTPETSGGLLLTAPEAVAGRLRDYAEEHGMELYDIGRVEEGTGLNLV